MSERAKLNPIEERVLLLLAEHKDDGLSPEAIAKQLEITDGQVQQAVGTLVRLGFVAPSEAVTP